MATTLNITLAKRLRGKELSRETAIPLRKRIELAWTKTDKIELDFAGLGFVSVSFMDEFIGKLFTRFEKTEVISKVVIINLDREDRILLGNIINSRIRQRRESLEET